MMAVVLVLMTLLHLSLPLVIGQATILTDPSIPVIGVGDSVDVICDSGSSDVSPSIFITSNTINSYVKITTDTNQMTIHQLSSATCDNNGDRFTCTATGLSSSNEVVLNVLFPPVISSIKATNAFEGSEAIVELTVKANPQVMANNVTITKRGLPQLRTIHNVNINGSRVTITYSNLMRSDAGDYVVTVTNTEGSDVVTFSLNIFFGPNFLQRPSYSTCTNNEIVGVTLILNCSVDSNPPATVTFTTTANTTSNVAINPTTGIVTITNTVLGNTGDYTCIANNTLISTTQTYAIAIGNVPSEILTLSSIFYNDNNNQLIINYYTQSNRDQSILRYEVSCYNCPSFTPIPIPSPLPPSPVTITIPASLACSTTYNIRVTAFNAFGSSVIGYSSFTSNDCTASTLTPTIDSHDDHEATPGSSAGLVGTTLLVMVLGTIATAMI